MKTLPALACVILLSVVPACSGDDTAPENAPSAAADTPRAAAGRSGAGSGPHPAVTPGALTPAALVPSATVRAT